MIIGIVVIFLIVSLFIWDSVTYGKFFMKPLDEKDIVRGKQMSSPWLGTINLTGGTMVKAERTDPLTGHFLYINMFVIFGISIFPFGAYIATEGKRSGYTIYGEVTHYKRDFFHEFIRGWMWLSLLALLLLGISYVVEKWDAIPWWACGVLVVAVLLVVIGLFLIVSKIQDKMESKRFRTNMWKQYEKMEEERLAVKPKCPIQEDGESDEAYTKRVDEYVKADTEWRKRHQNTK